MLSKTSKNQCRKKAALCLLRLLRKYPEGFEEVDTELRDKLLDFLEDNSLGIVTASVSLIIGLVSHHPHLWGEVAVHKACKLLSKLNHSTAANQYGSEYIYYKTICPWLQIKLLRLLQYYPAPEREEVYTKLCETLSKLISDVQMQKNVNMNNSAHAVLFEAVNYVIHMETNKELIAAAVNVLGQRMSSSNQPNYRYLALDAMQRMSHIPEAAEQFKKHEEVIIKSLKDKDISLRRRALDVLYSMCDSNNSEVIVGQLLDYLQTSPDAAMREELVLRIAILGERFSPNLHWYVDTILKLMSLAGEHVSDQIWMRVVQIVTNKEELQVYAAETCQRALRSETVHESMIKCGGYIIGEFGHLMVHKHESSASAQWLLLKDKFHTCKEYETKQVLLSAFVKLINAHPQLKPQITELMQTQTTTMDAELQQRAVEYLALAQAGRQEMLETVMDVMPNYPERESILTRKIREREQATTDRTLKQIQTEQNKHEEEEPKTLNLTPASLTHTKGRGATATAPAQSRAAASNGSADLLDMSEPAAPPAHASNPARSELDDLLGPPAPSTQQASGSAPGGHDLLGGPGVCAGERGGRRRRQSDG